MALYIDCHIMFGKRSKFVGESKNRKQKIISRYSVAVVAYMFSLDGNTLARCQNVIVNNRKRLQHMYTMKLLKCFLCRKIEYLNISI